MGRNVSRRRFVQSTLAAGVLSAAAVPHAHIKVGLYSITYGGVWYRGDALTVEQVIGRARKFGYQGIEIDGKRPHGNPLDMPKARCQQLRKLAADHPVGLPSRASAYDLRPWRENGAHLSCLAWRHFLTCWWRQL